MFRPWGQVLAVLAALAAGIKGLALDLSTEKLKFADSLGVHHTVNAGHPDVVETIDELSDGGVHVAIETAGLHMLCKQLMT